MRCYSFALVLTLCFTAAHAQRRALLEGPVAPAPAPATDAVSATGAYSAPPPVTTSETPVTTPRPNQTPPGAPAPPPPPPPPPPIYYAPWVEPTTEASAPASSTPASSTPASSTPASSTPVSSTPDASSSSSSASAEAAAAAASAAASAAAASAAAAAAASSSGYTPPTHASAPVGSGAPAPTDVTMTPIITMPAPAPEAQGHISPAAQVPAVSAIIVLPNYVLQTFDLAAQAQFIRAIEAAYPLSNVAVKINSVTPGSVIVNETTTFLDGDARTATNNAAALTTSPQNIFPSIAFGNVTVSNVTMGNVTNPGATQGATTTHTPSSGAGPFAMASMSVVVGAVWLLSFAM